jgi:hypothetical protein
MPQHIAYRIAITSPRGSIVHEATELNSFSLSQRNIFSLNTQQDQLNHVAVVRESQTCFVFNASVSQPSRSLIVLISYFRKVKHTSNSRRKLQREPTARNLRAAYQIR